VPLGVAVGPGIAVLGGVDVSGDPAVVLGDHQDAVVARPVLRELAVTAQLDNENGFTYGLLHQQQTDLVSSRSIASSRAR
jgi:hypothetical protein